MNFKPGDRVICIEGVVCVGCKGTIIDATKTKHKDEYGELGVRFDNEKYYDEHHFHILKYFRLKHLSKLDQVLS